MAKVEEKNLKNEIDGETDITVEDNTESDDNEMLAVSAKTVEPKEDAVDRTVALGHAIERIDKSIKDHRSGLERTKKERDDLLEGKREMEIASERRVLAELESSFMGKSEGGLLDSILRLKLADPKLTQITQNIQKLRVKAQFHAKHIADLTKEQADCERELDKIKAGEVLQACYKSYLAFHASVVVNEEAWQSFKTAVGSTHKQRLNYNKALKAHGIEDQMFFEVIQQRMRSGVLKKKLQSELVGELSRIRQIRPNCWYVEPGQGNERRHGVKKVHGLRNDWSK